MFTKAYKLNLLLATNVLMVSMVLLAEFSACGGTAKYFKNSTTVTKLNQLREGFKGVEYVMVSEYSSTSTHVPKFTHNVGTEVVL